MVMLRGMGCGREAWESGGGWERGMVGLALSSDNSCQVFVCCLLFFVLEWCRRSPGIESGLELRSNIRNKEVEGCLCAVYLTASEVACVLSPVVSFSPLLCSHVA